MTDNNNGNATAMREALAKLRQRFDNDVMAYQDRYFKFSGWHWHKKATEAARWRDVFSELRDVCDAALAKPARNCDVGTPGEQSARMAEFCRAQYERSDGVMLCSGCQFHNIEGLDCQFAWAQMTYNGGDKC